MRNATEKKARTKVVCFVKWFRKKIIKICLSLFKVAEVEYAASREGRLILL